MWLLVFCERGQRFRFRQKHVCPTGPAPCVHRRLSPAQACSRPPSSPSTPCMSPGQPWLTTPVSPSSECEIQKGNVCINMLLTPLCASSDRQCNPSLLSLVQNTSSLPKPGPTPPAPTTQWWDAQSIVGLVIFLFCTLYARSVFNCQLQGFSSHHNFFFFTCCNLYIDTDFLCSDKWKQNNFIDMKDWLTSAVL